MATAAEAAPLELKPYKSLDNATLAARIRAVKESMGKRLLILGHHYQQDEVIALSDLRGDSYQLSQMAAANTECRAIAFCGVHFMAETADMLVNRPERLAERNGERVPVVLPDMAAGCSMADMAAIEQVEAAWEEMGEVIDTKDITPVTYINSAASLKAFCGTQRRHRLHEQQRRGRAEVGLRAHEPRAVLSRSASRSQHGVRDGHSARPDAGLESARRRARRQQPKQRSATARSCSGKDTAASTRSSGRSMSISSATSIPASRCWCIRNARAKSWRSADVFGSTGKIIREVEAAPPGTKWAIGTELHLVNRLKQEHPEQEIHFLSPIVCMCATMYRIDLAHLCWSLENLAAGTPVNVIRVDDETTHWSLTALERMLEVK